MSIGTFAELQDEVIVWTYRTDVAARVPNWIVLAEADMQVRCKLVDFEASATVTIAAGAGTLPTGFTGMRSVYWDGSTDQTLRYVTPDRFEAMQDDAGTGLYYTIRGTQIRVTPGAAGSLVMTYKPRFTPLSASNTTNVLLTNYPDAYLRGTLLQFALWSKDRERVTEESALFEAAIQRIISDNNDRKYAGVTLEVRPR